MGGLSREGFILKYLALSSCGPFLALFEGHAIATMRIAKPLQRSELLQTR